MELCPPLPLGIVAIEKGAFGSPSTKERQLYFLLYSLLDTTCFNYAADNFIRITSLCDRKLSTPNITAQQNQCYVKDGSTSTVRRTLCEAGLYGRIAVNKPLLRKQNNVKRLLWAKIHKDWTIEQWNKVLWNLWVKQEGLCTPNGWWKSCNPLYHTSCKAWKMLCYDVGAFANCKVGDLHRWKANGMRLAITAYCSIT